MTSLMHSGSPIAEESFRIVILWTREPPLLTGDYLIYFTDKPSIGDIYGLDRSDFLPFEYHQWRCGGGSCVVLSPFMGVCRLMKLLNYLLL